MEKKIISRSDNHL